VGTTKLDLDASCNENGLDLFSDPTPCFLVPIIVKCIKLVSMEAQTLLDFNASTCFINKELVQQYKLAIVENNTLVLVEVINGQNFSSGLVTYETKALDITIGFHTNKVVFNVISFPKNLVIIGLFWFVLHNP
jgi:hypothetical protein